MRPRGATGYHAPAARRDPVVTLLDDAPESTPRVVWYGRVAALVGMSVWCASVSLGRLTEIPTILHLTVILFHEAGHVLFAPFGEVIRIAGGTIGQLLMPAICAVSLFRRGTASAPRSASRGPA